MATTIQIDEKTLLLLKKLKEELDASSYDEAITKIVMKQRKQESMASSLKKYMGKKSLKDLLNNYRDKNDRL
jgi:hypothetical protein